MQTDALSRSTGKCANPRCNKTIILRSVRDKEPQFCSRICASSVRYNTRYRGTNSGPLERPTEDKTTF